jgi:hypothetical protein
MSSKISCANLLAYVAHGTFSVTVRIVLPAISRFGNPYYRPDLRTPLAGAVIQPASHGRQVSRQNQ